MSLTAVSLLCIIDTRFLLQQEAFIMHTYLESVGYRQTPFECINRSTGILKTGEKLNCDLMVKGKVFGIKKF